MGWLVFGDKLSFINIIGLTITLGDIIWYNFYRFEQQKEINDAKTAIANASLSSSTGGSNNNNINDIINKNDDINDMQYELNDTEDNYNYSNNYNYGKEIGSVNMDMTNTSGNTSTNNNITTTTATPSSTNNNTINTSNNGNDGGTVGSVGISVSHDVSDSIVESIELNHLNIAKSRGASSSSSYIIDSESKAK
ncbi:unnamed protein product [[Candida] boidinii]|uniref:Unnamed protein product n=1 Tax=Candida boidinii TaxID=5477 RepID=A0ACB5U462_CANBO|nr:unnamed protein product [[Candida] boidinii]GMF66620.1 unnamed protein product [[Candida] boidinii]